MKKSELKQIVKEVISEIYEMEQSNLKEKAPPGMKDDVKKMGGTPEAYKKAWKQFYSQHGDKEKANKQVKEMWLATESSGKHDETDMSNPEEKKEVDIAKNIKKHVDSFLKMHGQLKEDEADMSDPSEKKEVDHAKEIKKLADKLISMHKS
jgi:hypothetical protein